MEHSTRKKAVKKAKMGKALSPEDMTFVANNIHEFDKWQGVQLMNQYSQLAPIVIENIKENTQVAIELCEIQKAENADYHATMRKIVDGFEVQLKNENLPLETRHRINEMLYDIAIRICENEKENKSFWGSIWKVLKDNREILLGLFGVTASVFTAKTAVDVYNTYKNDKHQPNDSIPMNSNNLLDTNQDDQVL